ncbi:hypothetical protein HanRHA438_Chr14g0670301 [Helianthus annuus]|nr:hypothetical protein HanRHA438_Chr14g0670301 [Helianthus annuus]
MDCIYLPFYCCSYIINQLCKVSCVNNRITCVVLFAILMCLYLIVLNMVCHVISVTLYDVKVNHMFS